MLRAVDYALLFPNLPSVMKLAKAGVFIPYKLAQASNRAALIPLLPGPDCCISPSMPRSQDPRTPRLNEWKPPPQTRPLSGLDVRRPLASLKLSHLPHVSGSLLSFKDHGGPGSYFLGSGGLDSRRESGLPTMALLSVNCSNFWFFPSISRKPREGGVSPSLSELTFLLANT